MSERAAFLSYAHHDDEAEGGRLRKLATKLSKEVQSRTGQEFAIFVDRDDIPWGANWNRVLREGLEQSTFLIPVVTPSYFASPYCQDELAAFLAKEERLGRDDLVCPVYHIDVALLNDESQRSRNQLAVALHEHQYVDWRDLRLTDLSSVRVRKTIGKMADRLATAMDAAKAVPTEASAIEPESKSDDEQSLLELIQQFAVALTDRDTDFFNSVLDDYLIYRKVNGIQVGKPHLLEELAGRVTFMGYEYHHEAEDADVITHGENIALVSSRLRIKFGVFTRPSIADIHMTQVFLKRNGAWKCAVWLNTREQQDT